MKNEALFIKTKLKNTLKTKDLSCATTTITTSTSTLTSTETSKIKYCLKKLKCVLHYYLYHTISDL